MNRRLFLKTLAGVGLVAALPLPALLEAPPTVKRQTEIFDYGFMRGLAVSVERGSLKARHGVRLQEQAWRAMTLAQREGVWRLVEDKASRLLERMAT